MRGRLIEQMQEYIKRHNPEMSIEELFADFQKILKVHAKFERHCKNKRIKFDMPKKSERAIARRRAFVNWYIAEHPEKGIEQCIRELSELTFSSRRTLYYTVFGYR